MYKLTPDKDIKCKKIKIPRRDGKMMSVLILSPKDKDIRGVHAPGVLWIHGGGYIVGTKEMVHMSRAVDLVKRYGAVVISPGYRLAFTALYPAAVEDCYDALLYLKAHADLLGVNRAQIMVGGESTGDTSLQEDGSIYRDYISDRKWKG